MWRPLLERLGGRSIKRIGAVTDWYASVHLLRLFLSLHSPELNYLESLLACLRIVSQLYQTSNVQAPLTQAYQRLQIRIHLVNSTKPLGPSKWPAQITRCHKIKRPGALHNTQVMIGVTLFQQIWMWNSQSGKLHRGRAPRIVQSQKPLFRDR
jgi:hypothetical protein